MPGRQIPTERRSVIVNVSSCRTVALEKSSVITGGSASICVLRFHQSRKSRDHAPPGASGTTFRQMRPTSWAHGRQAGVVGQQRSRGPEIAGKGIPVARRSNRTGDSASGIHDLERRALSAALRTASRVPPGKHRPGYCTTSPAAGARRMRHQFIPLRLSLQRLESVAVSCGVQNTR